MMNFLRVDEYQPGGFSISITNALESVLSTVGIPMQWIEYSKLVVFVAIACLIVFALQFVVRAMLSFIIKKAHKTTGASFLDYLSKNRLPHYVALLAPYTFIRNFIPIMFSDFPRLISPATKMADIYLVLLVLWSIIAVIQSFINVLQERPAFAHRPMRSYVQVISIILYVLGTIVAFSIISGQSTGAILAAMGAASAVTMLVFQDSIKGFVGSIQMTTNNMVQLDDWITMDKYKADGNVEEINLTTVKVRNFDNTVTTIPTYALVSDSFQNWQPMQTSGGRRIKRSLFMKQGSIRFMKEDELAKYDEVDCLSKLITEKKKQYASISKKLIDGTVPITNNDLFMAYAQDYLDNHPEMNKTMTVMFRQGAPTSEGLPLEVYVFTSNTSLMKHEQVGADIINHLIGMVPYFDLKLFEMLSDTAENQ